MKLPYIIASVILAVALGSCSKNESSNTTTPSNGGNDSGILESVVAKTAPEGAVGVVDARAKAKPGEAITIRGKVGGKTNPISDAAAILVLADEKAITSCDDIPGDECETPWDYCCEESSKIAASTTTIQVSDGDGKIVRSTLRGLSGLKELSHLVIAGTVDPSSTSEALIVNAERIHVEKP